ncbi:hypothetical protein L5515_007371 [Caenorhabditis briggsae]|uniref:Uncharacterized protein n=1 Tax=Caenorhabditis briggsae TaxID=6238 RepID=A0AAE9F4X7_CAEBR|nr:hypothetical protein L5515_007371 [Caenorhabditis briggsae]
MAKRKNGGTANTREAKTAKFDQSPVKADKRAAHSSDTDDDEEEPANVEAEETRHDEGEFNYEPDQFRVLVESFTEHVHSHENGACSVHNMERVVADWIKTQDELIDARCFITDYRKYLKQAVRFRNYQLTHASPSLIAYLGSDKALPEFSSYPDRLQTKVQLYIKRNNIEFKGSIGGKFMKDLHSRMQNDKEGTRECEEELQELKTQLMPNLQEFLDSHPNLTDEQKKHISAKIAALERQCNPKTPTPKTPKKKGKEVVTAYSLFCKSKNDKYRDLSEVEREKKLAKKFAKLPDETRDITTVQFDHSSPN